ncbi:MAG: malate:quinone oxidoreductase [Verrucomicrobia bacterium]|nr:malate:quinone oxidoreductase [Verrucomicrobiota bacterium]
MSEAASSFVSDASDVVLIGSGIMSANLGAMLKRLDPRLSIQMIEITSEHAREAIASVRASHSSFPIHDHPH